MSINTEDKLKEAIGEAIMDIKPSPIRKRILIRQDVLDNPDGYISIGGFHDKGSRTIKNSEYLMNKIMGIFDTNEKGEIYVLDSDLIESIHLERGVQEEDFKVYVDVCITIKSNEVSG